jgi:conjugal transfer/type IV secretion protein DotA/TraY
MESETFWSLIFGTSGESLYSLWTAVEGSHPFVALLKVVNYGLLGALVVVALYTALVSIIDTMRTGRPGGDVASVWSVIRLVTSLFGLLPIFAGYSAFSLVVLSVAYGANSLGNQAMRPYAESMIANPDGSAETYASVIGTMKAGAGDQIVAGLYQSAMCATAMNRTTEDSVTPVVVSAKSRPVELVQEGNIEYWEAGVSYGAEQYGIARDGCGSVNIVVPADTNGQSTTGDVISSRRARTAHENILQTQQAVQQLVDESFNDPNLPKERMQTRLAAISAEYEARDAQARADLVRVVDGVARARMIESSAQVGGASWMLAGAWYYDFGKMYQVLHDVLRIQPNVKNPDWSNFSVSQRNELGGELARLDELSDGNGLVDMLKRYSTVVTRPYAGPVEIIFKSFYDGSKAVQLWTSQFLASTNDDPVRSIQNLGFVMLTTIEVAWAVTVMVRALGATATAVDFLPGDTGVMTGVLQVIMDVTSPLIAIWWTLFSFAIALAYYLPLLPAILFSFAVISWLLDVVEGVLAAGFFAVMNAMPDGNGFFSNYGQSAIGALMGIVIRPPIMVATLVVSVYIMSFGAKLLLYGFNTAQSDALQDTTTGIVTTVALFAIFTLLMLALARKVFGMIVTVPEAVGSWIGARFAGRGDDQTIGEIENRFGFAGAVQSLMKPRARGKSGKGNRKPRNKE